MSEDKIAEIRARHELVGSSGSVIRPTGFSWTIPGWVAHNDRAALLAEVERQRAENERLFNEDTKTRHALKGWVFVCPDGGDEPTHERVAAVVAEVERLRAQIGRLRSKIKWLIEDDERLHYLLYRIANPPPFADCPVEMAQNATRGEHLRREAFDGIRRELEDKP